MAAFDSLINRIGYQNYIHINFHAVWDENLINFQPKDCDFISQSHLFESELNLPIPLA